MKIRLLKASDWEWEVMREVNTADDFAKIIEEFGHGIVIEPPHRNEDIYHVIIYDDYIE